MAVSAFVSDRWKDYEILDAGDGEKLERWGAVTVVRPDPQIIWPRTKPDSLWLSRDMHYHRSKSGGGQWEFISPKTKTPAQWTVAYEGLSFIIRPTDFKHMGLFPEQAANWDWAAKLIQNAGRKVRVLNLFGYTGGATVCCLNAGADVTHIDAAKGMNQWAKDNIKAAGFECRVITDDVYKFVQREQRRGNTYDAIILDPPSYGRGPNGEVWKLEDRLYGLLRHCSAILSEQPLFVLLNTYTTGFTATAAENVLRLAVGGGRISSAPLGLPIGDSKLILPCGMTVRWSAAN